MNTSSLRALARVSLALASAAACLSAHAEHKLFPTDVVSLGEVDVSADLSSEKTKGEGRADNGLRVNAEATADELALGLRVGVGDRAHLGLTVAPGSIELPDGSSTDYKRYGLSLRFSPQTQGPLSVALDLGVSNIKAKYSRSANLYNAGVSVGYKLASGIRPYGTLAVEAPDTDDGIVEASLEGGAWIPVHPRITVIPSAKIVFRDSSVPGLDNSTGLGLGVAAIAHVNGNTYVKPEFSYSTYELGGVDIDETRLGIKLYHKF